MNLSARSINNPLALIAVLAATTEASALASLPLLDNRNQSVFVWFLVGFPPFLTALFFITLNFNRKALQAGAASQQETLEVEPQDWLQSSAMDAAMGFIGAKVPEVTQAQSQPIAASAQVPQPQAAQLHVFEYPSEREWQQLRPMVTAWADSAIAQSRSPQSGALILLVHPHA